MEENLAELHERKRAEDAEALLALVRSLAERGAIVLPDSARAETIRHASLLVAVSIEGTGSVRDQFLAKSRAFFERQLARLGILDAAALLFFSDPRWERALFAFLAYEPRATALVFEKGREEAETIRRGRSEVNRFPELTRTLASESLREQLASQLKRFARTVGSPRGESNQDSPA